MKIIIACLITLVCTLLGKAISEIYVKRESFFFELVSFSKDAIRAITLLKEPIGKCVSEYPEIKEIADAPDCIFGKRFLRKNEQIALHEFFKKFGLSDSALEGKRTEDFLKFSLDALASAKSEKEVKGKLCIKLGFIIGIALAVICM